MDDEALKEKFRKRKEEEDLEEQERKRVISEKTAELKKIETDILNEVDEWKKVLPKTPDLIDEVAFHKVPNHSFYLKKKKDDNEIYVVIKREGREDRVLKVADFIEGMMAQNKDLLLNLKNRISGFMRYIGTKV